MCASLGVLSSYVTSFLHLCLQVTVGEIRIWKTPAGVLSSEFGLQVEFAAEAAVEKNVRKVCASTSVHLYTAS